MRRRVVDAHVDPAEPLDRLGSTAATTCVLVADVADDRQRLPARRLDLLGRGVDRALELGVGLGGLGDQRDVGAVAGRPQRDGQPDAAAGAGDEQGLVGESRHGSSLASCTKRQRRRAGCPAKRRPESTSAALARVAVTLSVPLFRPGSAMLVRRPGARPRRARQPPRLTVTTPGAPRRDHDPSAVRRSVVLCPELRPLRSRADEPQDAPPGRRAAPEPAPGANRPAVVPRLRTARSSGSARAPGRGRACARTLRERCSTRTPPARTGRPPAPERGRRGST